MGSPLTLTMANCYMFFFEQNIIKQINNSGGLYVRYIDDIFITVNWPERHLDQQIKRWDSFDININLKASYGKVSNFLDLYLENRDGKLITKVYHKPSYEHYYLPFNSIHPIHMKKNVPYALTLRSVRYCSSFELYIQERESIVISLLLNKYPLVIIEEQLKHVFQKFGSNQPTDARNYDRLRETIIYSQHVEVQPIDYNNNIFVHFTFCIGMRQFPKQFLTLWQKYFDLSPINDIKPILGTRHVKNLHRELVFKQ